MKLEYFIDVKVLLSGSGGEHHSAELSSILSAKQNQIKANCATQLEARWHYRAHKPHANLDYLLHAERDEHEQEQHDATARETYQTLFMESKVRPTRVGTQLNEQSGGAMPA